MSVSVLNHDYIQQETRVVRLKQSINTVTDAVHFDVSVTNNESSIFSKDDPFIYIDFMANVFLVRNQEKIRIGNFHLDDHHHWQFSKKHTELNVENLANPNKLSSDLIKIEWEWVKLNVDALLIEKYR